ncbi:unnamed protein product [Ranitomeya imitator]|uniref:Reverse transcriptase domain-containing protein n=1 Tax=Ranitomeya imitator TaxID=111125 RepID=A0ABN9MH49_9NEOB|nr:unnamed protein product [Ranitomeya imitator]
MTTRSGATSRRLKDLNFHPYRRNARSPEGKRYENKVINLSDIEFTPVDIALLNKGLSFSPAAPIDAFAVIKDIQLFARSLLFKRYFFDPNMFQLFPTEEEQTALRILEELSIENNTTEGGKIPPSIRPRSRRFLPLSSCPSIDLFVQIVSKDIMSIPRHIYRDNLTMEERGRLRVLGNLEEVVIKQADKGGNVVIWPKRDYEKEAFRQLNNKTCYQKLTFNPLSAFTKQLLAIINKAQIDGIITKELAEALVVAEPTIATFYMLPKIHKDARSPPGRPIISGTGNYLERVNQWIDSKLQPLVEELPSFLKDTGELLRRVDGLHLEKDAVLGSFFLQLQGTAMGASFAPAYAGLFLGLWERDLFLSDRVESMCRVLTWTRYIDDILMIWQGPSGELDSTDEGGMSNAGTTCFLAKDSGTVSQGDGMATGVAGSTGKGNQGLTTRAKAYKRLRLEMLFSGKEKPATLAPQDGFSLSMFGLYNKSDFVPPANDPVIETFCRFVKADKARLRHNKIRCGKPNLTHAERREIGVLKNNKSITIKPADKGMALVVMDTSQYIGEIRLQLSDGNVYEKLQVNPTQRFQLELEGMIDRALDSGLIDTKLAKYLKVEHPVVPVLYTLPKIHKDLQRPPGRPIVSGLYAIKFLSFWIAY